MRWKFRTLAVVVALVLVAGQFAYWRIAAERVRAGYKNWLGALVASGWTVSSASPSIGGWPRAAVVSVPNLTLRHVGPTVPGDVEVVSAGMALSVTLLSPATLRISVTGPTHVRMGAMQDLLVTSDENWALLPLQPEGPLQADFYASGLRIEPATGAWHATAGLLNGHATIAEAPPADASEPGGKLWLSAEAIALPTVINWPLGPNISSLSLDGVLNGPVPQVRDITAWAEAWRDGGGSLAISHLALGWGPLGLTSSATLALDDQLQPMGSGNGRIVGYAATLDRLAAAGMLSKSAATAAKAVLSLMAGSGDSNEPSAVDVPLTLQYRTLSMRQVPLIRLPELDWPAR